MHDNIKSRETIANRLLAALPTAEYQRLLPNLEEISLIYANVIYEPNDLISHVYFPNSGIISLLSAVTMRDTLEVGIVGNEGMVGLPVFLGVGISRNRAIIQGEGVAVRMKVSDFQRECDRNGALALQLRRFTNSLITQISQSAVCNRYHLIEARLARWLLMTQDRMEADNFRITHDFLANMLGVRREGVCKAAGGLQNSQLITYKRGNLSILNRKGLEAIACQCYKIIKEEYDSNSRNLSLQP